MFWVSLLLLVVVCSSGASAQTNPGFIDGAVLCANAGCSSQSPVNPLSLNQAFMNKQDFGRTRLTAALTLYADFVNGNDANTCTAAGAGGACKTIQAAYNKLVANYDTAGFSVTISFNNNDTTGLLILNSWTGGGQLFITGPGGSPATIGINVTGTNGIAILSPLPAPLTLQGFAINVATSGNALQVQAPGVVYVKGINFGATSGSHIFAAVSGATIYCNAPYAISGGAQGHWVAVGGASIQAGGEAITITGTPAFSAFAYADTAADIYSAGTTFTGSATGQRYSATLNGVINTGSGGSVTALPGSINGITSTGGQYR